MIITGFQPLSLIDYPGHVSSVVFTQGCPFRCSYCHNPQLIPHTNQSPVISQNEILEYLCKHRKMLDGICITGGEPTIHHNLPDFIRTLKQKGFFVKLDTNGINPTMLQSLIEQKLIDYIAMDLKHVWEKYELVIHTNSIKIVENCKKTFTFIQESSISHEFRTTVYSGLHHEDDIIRIAMQLQPGERYAIQPIRYGVTLDPELTTTKPLDTGRIIDRLSTLRPDLELILRT